MTRLRYGLDRQWRFQRADRADVEVVDLPHSWNRTDTFQRGIEYFRGIGRYERDFPGPEPAAAPGEWYLCTEGFYGLAVVRLNGRRLGKFDGQYLGLEVGLGRWLRLAQDNHLSIEVSNKCPDYVLPGTDRPDFLLFGGLAGRVWLEHRPDCAFDERRLRVLTHDVLTSPEVEVHCALTTPPPAGATVRFTVTAANGATAAQWQESATGGELASRQPLTAAELWSPDSPVLYRLRADLVAGERLVDSVETRFGVRQAAFTEAGFMLNGERCALHGFNRHECLPGLGNALPSWLHREDARTLRALGANFVRLSHYPQHPTFLDACDEAGLLVYAELASWKSVRGGRWLRRAKIQMEAMIRRDRNHPSVILWGMGNESQHRRAYVALGETIRRLDPSRPSTYAENHLYRAKRARTLGLVDVWGLNYEVEAFDEVRHHATTGAVVVSEVCNQQAERGDIVAERRQVAAIEEFWRTLEGKPYVAGYALWAFNDYPTMFRQRHVRFTGKFDAWRLPKLAAWLCEARYADRPYVRLVADWGGVEPGTEVECDLIANCDRLTLTVGGRAIETAEGRAHQVVTVPFADQPLRAVAHRGEQVAEHQLEPCGAPHGIVLDPEPRGDGWFDLRVRVVDDKGARATRWGGEIVLESSGPVELAPLTAAGGIVVARGQGRLVGRRLADEPAEVRASGEGLAAARLELPPEVCAIAPPNPGLEPYNPERCR